MCVCVGGGGGGNGWGGSRVGNLCPQTKVGVTVIREGGCLMENRV